MSLILEQQEERQIPLEELSLKEKLHLMADVIRNHQGIEQCMLHFWEGGNRMCVMGLLGYRAGMPKEDLRQSHNYCEVMKRYGINLEEERTPLIEWHHMEATLWQLWRYNDNGATFDEIADIIDHTADNL